MRTRLDARRWAEVLATFDAVVELEESAREERLASISASDPELGRAVEELLRADQEAGTLLAHLDFVLGPVTSRSGSDTLEADPLNLVGRSVSHFRVLETLAYGGMGVVYRAEDTHLRRAIALKFPLPAHHFDRSTKERFLHEARLAGGLDHPNLCGIHEAGETADGLLFLAMPLYAGETLKARLTRENRLPIEAALDIARQIAQGLSAAHRAGIVHRDLKPANVMLLPDGTVKILDFGVAKVRDQTLTASWTRPGTASYMAPEQVKGGELDGRADLWALGVVLYEMLAGRRPFEGGQEVALAHAILQNEPIRLTTSRPEVPPEIEQLVVDLLRKDPGERIGSAAEVAAYLTSAAGAASGAGARSAVSAAAARSAVRKRGDVPRTPGAALRGSWRGRRPNLIAAAALLLAVGSGAWLLTRSAATAPEARTLAVLSFDHRGDEESRHVAFGLSDVVNSKLSRLSSLALPGETSLARIGRRPLPQLAEELGVAHVLRGVVQREGDRFVLDAELVEGANSRTVWQRRYSVTPRELPELPTHVARAVVDALGVSLSEDERIALSRPPTRNSEAFILYLRGREVELRGAPQDVQSIPGEQLRAAQSFYWRARELDPEFALARGRLALSHIYSAIQYDPTEARREQARLEAETALRLDPNLPEAHDAMAHYWEVAGDHGRKAEALTRGLRGAPNNADFHLRLGGAYRALGRWENAIAELQHAQRVDPSYPGGALHLGLTYWLLRRYPDAVRELNRVLALQPDAHNIALLRGHLFLSWRGSTDTLANSIERIPPDWDSNGMATWARFRLARVERRPAEGLQALDSADNTLIHDLRIYRPMPLLRGQSYQALGDRARARAEFEAARALLSDSVAAHPDDPRMRISLGLALAGLGRRTEAVREAQRAMELAPLSRDFVAATNIMGGAVEVFALAGETDEALELLELLLAMPAGRDASVPLLRVDPAFDPLRGDPRFARLLARFSGD